MTELVSTGRRLDKLRDHILKNQSKDVWILNSVVPLFLEATKSVTTLEEEQLVLRQLNNLMDSYEFRYNELFETDSYCPTCLKEYLLEYADKLEEAEHRGRKVTLGKPFYTPGGPKKRSVYVKNAKGNVVKVNFGDPNMKIKKNIPARRKSYRARHHCDNPGPRWKANYWSCKAW
jgi:hypothetical protein